MLHPFPTQFTARRAPATTAAASILRLGPDTLTLPDTTHCATVWVCLFGSFVVDGRDGPFLLTRGQFLTLPPDHRPTFLSGANGLALLVTLPQLVSTPARARTALQPGLFALRSKASIAMLHSALALLRHGHVRDADWRTHQITRLLRLAQADQPQIVDWLTRVPGRTQVHRFSTLQRLLHARNLILNRPGEDNDLDSLAAASCYSRSHFVKAFREVFGETPGSLHASARIALAKLLIARSGMSIGEIAEDVGYGSRCAFARMFKSQVGINASSFRKKGERLAALQRAVG